MSVLTKENYEAIAAILKLATTKRQIVEGLVEYFKVNNPRFDATRFLQAVGGERTKVTEIGRMRATPAEINMAIDVLGREKEGTFPWAGEKRSYELRREGPGKFESGFLVNRFVHALSLEESELIGDVTEVGWAAVPVPLGPSAVKEVMDLAEDLRDTLTQDERAFIADMHGAVVVEDDQGFVEVEYFEGEREYLDRIKEWERAEAEFREGGE